MNGAEVDFATVASMSSMMVDADDFAFRMGSGSGSTLINSMNELDLPLYSNLSIFIPSNAFDEIEDQNETGVFFSFYLTPSLFLVADESFIVGSPVVAASIAGREVSNLESPVIITLQTLRESVSLSS